MKPIPAPTPARAAFRTSLPRAGLALLAGAATGGGAVFAGLVLFGALLSVGSGDGGADQGTGVTIMLGVALFAGMVATVVY